MGQPVVHFEIMGKDGQKLADFYRKAFDWQVDSVPGGTPYWLVKKDDDGIGGGVGASDDGQARLTVYVQVADCAAALKKVEALGARTLMERTVMPGMVTFAMFADPAGNVVGLVEPGTPPA